MAFGQGGIQDWRPMLKDMSHSCAFEWPDGPPHPEPPPPNPNDPPDCYPYCQSDDWPPPPTPPPTPIEPPPLPPGTIAHPGMFNQVHCFTSVFNFTPFTGTSNFDLSLYNYTDTILIETITNNDYFPIPPPPLDQYWTSGFVSNLDFAGQLDAGVAGSGNIEKAARVLPLKVASRVAGTFNFEFDINFVYAHSNPSGTASGFIKLISTTDPIGTIQYTIPASTNFTLAARFFIQRSNGKLYSYVTINGIQIFPV